jgi:hypothetical protein
MVAPFYPIFTRTHFHIFSFFIISLEANNNPCDTACFGVGINKKSDALPSLVVAQNIYDRHFQCLLPQKCLLY